MPIRKRRAALLLSVCLLLSVIRAGAAGGADDPLISLSYLEGKFSAQVAEETDKKLDASDRRALENQGTGPQTWTEARLKQHDTLTAFTGTEFTLLAGQARADTYGGTVLDMTTGQEVPIGGALVVNHRYLAAEETAVDFTILSKTAVVTMRGSADCHYADTVDYNAMASALKTLHLFRGSFTGYGQGFDLEKAPTRLQALIMFIRVLGEEKEALAWTGSTPFRDLEKGSDAEKYVGYAYERGYTNGFTATAFRPGGAVNSRQYTEFMLRALVYSSAANTDLSDTLQRAVEAGVLTSGERDMLQRDPFLRAELVYISWVSLEAMAADTDRTLGDTLKDRGVFTRAEYRQAQALVPGSRIY